MAPSNNERLWSRAWRAAKTLFFVANMLASLLLVCAPPLLVALLDLLLPFALLAAANRPFSSSQLRTFRFRDSLLDLPLISTTRSLLILCFYLCCNGRGLYLGVTAVCGVASVGYASVKAVMMFGPEALRGQGRLVLVGVKEGPAAVAAAVEALFLSSMALAMAHVVAAYRISCRERRKLLVYKFDVEAVSVYNNEFPSYHKIALSK